MTDPAGLFNPILISDEIARVTSSSNWVQKMVDVEVALAAVQADLGLIPTDAAEEIATLSNSHGIDPDELGRLARSSGTPVVPLVRLLGERLPETARAWIHYGSTSQDILDTATMLVAKEALALVLSDAISLCSKLSVLADENRTTLMVSRTLMQHALPYTFGLKCAVWLSGIVDAVDNLCQIYTNRLSVQVGGAGGTLAAFGGMGSDVAAKLGSALGLGVATVPWHALRGRVIELGNALTTLTGALAKIATDVSLASQAEVAEFSESQSGGGGSSAMPQKVNPVGSIVINACFRRCQGLNQTLVGSLIVENERGASEWQAEWQTLREILQLSGSAINRTVVLISNLSVNSSKMLENLNLSRGNVMSERLLLELSKNFGRTEAHDLVRSISMSSAKNGTSLLEELNVNETLRNSFTEEQIKNLLDPKTYLGSSDHFVTAAISQSSTSATKWASILGV